MRAAAGQPQEAHRRAKQAWGARRSARSGGRGASPGASADRHAEDHARSPAASRPPLRPRALTNGRASSAPRSAFEIPSPENGSMVPAASPRNIAPCDAGVRTLNRSGPIDFHAEHGGSPESRDARSGFLSIRSSKRRWGDFAVADSASIRAISARSSRPPSIGPRPRVSAIEHEELDAPIEPPVRSGK